MRIVSKFQARKLAFEEEVSPEVKKTTIQNGTGLLTLIRQKLSRIYARLGRVFAWHEASSRNTTAFRAGAMAMASFVPTLRLPTAGADK